MSILNYLHLPHSTENEKSKQLFELLAKSSTSLYDFPALEALIHEAEKIKNPSKIIFPLFNLDEAITQYESLHKIDFYKEILPSIIKYALESKSVFSNINKLETLSRGKRSKLTFTAGQIRSLLSNAFLNCVATVENISEIEEYGDINFWKIFVGRNEKLGNERVKCLLSYFHQTRDKDLLWNLEFYRKWKSPLEVPEWENLQDLLILEDNDVIIHNSGGIESSSAGVHVDFANKYLHIHEVIPSCTQEEVLFSLRPELFVGLLFCDKMEDNEVICINGARLFSKYSGYGFSFIYKGHATCSYDSLEKTGVMVCAMDSIVNHPNTKQFTTEGLSRDITKAYLGFSNEFTKAEQISVSNNRIATGNWGCGVFNGDRELKFIQQIMAAKYCNKKLDYYIFGDRFCVHFEQILKHLKTIKPSYSNLYKFLTQMNGVTPAVELLERYIVNGELIVESPYNYCFLM